jgi:hypothetical protein
MAVAPEIMVRDRWVPEPLAFKRRAWAPKTPLGAVVRDCLEYLPLGLAADLLDRVSSVVVLQSALSAVHWRRDDETGLQVPVDLGQLSHHVITDTGVAFLVDAWQNSVEMENLKYHGCRHRHHGRGRVADGARHGIHDRAQPRQHAGDRLANRGRLGQHLPHGRHADVRRHGRDHRARAVQPGRDRRRHDVGPFDVLGLDHQRRLR